MSKRWAGGLLALAVLAISAPAQAAPAPSRRHPARTTGPALAAIATAARVRIIGLPGGEPPSSAAFVGDVNGDGRDDLAIGVIGSSALDAGRVYVVFGRRHLGTVDLRHLGGQQGFRIDGAPPALDVQIYSRTPAQEQAGFAIAPAGDVNGDGRGDLLIGAPGASYRGRPFAGAVYVVLGRADGSPVQLGALGPGDGYRIDGPGTFTGAGRAVADAGDVNGDGRPDALIAAANAVYVVYGRPSGEAVDLANLGAAGFAITGGPKFDPGGPDASTGEQYAVAPAGDVNRDGLADLVIGSPKFDVPHRSGAGAAFVVYGRRQRARVDLQHLGPAGYRILGASGNSLGDAVAGVGDQNGDGRPDVVVSGTEPGGNGDRGFAYVAHSPTGPGTIDLAHPRPAQGYRIVDSSPFQHNLATTIAPAGDLNRDGRPDFLIGTPWNSYGCRSTSGSVYVIHGARRTHQLDLASARGWGARLDGSTRFAALGGLLASGQNVTGGARPDILTSEGGFSRNDHSTASRLELLTTPPSASPGPQSPCIGLSILRQRLSGVLRSGRLLVRLTLRGDFRHGPVRIELGADLPGGLVIAGPQTFSITRAGAHGIRLGLNADGRGALRGRRRVGLHMSSFSDDEVYIADRRFVLTG